MGKVALTLRFEPGLPEIQFCCIRTWCVAARCAARPRLEDFCHLVSMSFLMLSPCWDLASPLLGVSALFQICLAHRGHTGCTSTYFDCPKRRELWRLASSLHVWDFHSGAHTLGSYKLIIRTCSAVSITQPRILLMAKKGSALLSYY